MTHEGRPRSKPSPLGSHVAVRVRLALLPHIMRTASQVLTTDPKIVDYEANIFNDSFNAFFGVDIGISGASWPTAWQDLSVFAGATSMDYFFPRYAGCFVLTRGVAGYAISDFCRLVALSL